MNNINIEATVDSPKITLDYINAFIEIDGKSYPGNSMVFYAPILSWLEEYFNGNAKEKTIINIKLKYFNSSTAQVIFNIFDIINEGTYNSLELTWYYDDNNSDSYEDYEDMDAEFPDLNIKARKI